MAQINAELAIELAQHDLEQADSLFPRDQRLFNQSEALAWLLRTYRIFLPLIQLEDMFNYSVILSRIDRRHVTHQTPGQTRLDLYSAAGQITNLYKSFDQRDRY